MIGKGDATPVEMAKDSDSDLAHADTNEQQGDHMKPSWVEQKLETEEMAESEGDYALLKAETAEDTKTLTMAGDVYDLHACDSQSDTKAQAESIIGLVKKVFPRLAEKPTKPAKTTDVRNLIKEIDDENERWALTTQDFPSRKGSNDIVGTTIVIPSEPESPCNSSENSKNRPSKDSSPALSLRASMLSSSFLDGCQETGIDQVPIKEHDDGGTILGSTTDSVVMDDKIDFHLNADRGDIFHAATFVKNDSIRFDEKQDREECAHLAASNKESCEESDQQLNNCGITEEGHLKSSFEAVGKNLFISDKSNRSVVGASIKSNTSKERCTQGKERPMPSENEANVKSLKKRKAFKYTSLLLLFVVLVLIFYIRSTNSRDTRAPTPPELNRIEANTDNVYFFEDDYTTAQENKSPIPTTAGLTKEEENTNKTQPTADEELLVKYVVLENSEGAEVHASHQSYQSYDATSTIKILPEFVLCLQGCSFVLAADDIRRIVAAISCCLLTFTLWAAVRWANASTGKPSTTIRNKKRSMPSDDNQKESSTVLPKQKMGPKSPPRYMRYHQESDIFVSTYTAAIINKKGECADVRRSARNFEMKTK